MSYNYYLYLCKKFAKTGGALAPQDNADNSTFLALMAARNTALTAVDRSERLSTAVDITLTGRTGIETMSVVTSKKSDAWYTIDGRRVDSSQFIVHSSRLKKGIYIHNGHVVVIK